MKIKKYKGTFDLVLEFKIPDKISEKEVATWICETFKMHFVLIRHDWKIIAGGCVDNKKSYNYRSMFTEKIRFENTEYYELNCYRSDVTLFSLKWGEVL